MRLQKRFYNWGFEGGSKLLDKLTLALINLSRNPPFQPYISEKSYQIPKSKLPKVSIIFPNHNGDHNLLKTLLSSVEKSSYPKDKVEIVVVDNNSMAENVKFIEDNFPKIKLLKLKKNYGFAKAINFGFRKSTGNYLFITNNDVELEQECLEKLVNFLILNPKVGVVGGKVNDYKKRKQISCGALAYSFSTGNFVMSKKINEIQNSDWVIGCSMCTSRSLWKTLSGFDEDFFFTGEELDYCLRAKYKGFKIIYNPKGLLWHVGGATVKKQKSSHLSFEIYKSKLRIILKHGTLTEIITALFLQFFFFLPYRAIFLKDNSFLPLTKAFIWNITNMPKNMHSQRKLIQNVRN